MDFKDLIKLRQSNRAYQDRSVEKEKIELCLEAGRLSPSANNAQGWTFVIVDDAELKTRVAESAYRMGGAFVKQAQCPTPYRTVLNGYSTNGCLLRAINTPMHLKLSGILLVI
jgi:nitroreductase